MTFAVALDAIPGSVFQTLETNYPWFNNVFESLLTVDPKDPDHPKPLLASSWKVSEDNLSIDITLRDDVTFHTGRKMTADDVKYSFEQAAKPTSGSQLSFVPKAFQAMTVVSPTELKISFTGPQPSLFDFFNQTPIIDEKTASGLADGTRVTGTGPFMFTDWKPGASFTLKKYERYWNAKAVNLDSIQYVVTTDATALLSALRSGRAQIAMGITATDAKSFDGNNQYQVTGSGGTFYTFGMNTSVAPFNNPKVRQAVAYALDRDRINSQVLAKTGYVSDLYWGAATPGLNGDDVTHYSYDPDKAKQLIQEAGAAGATVPITFHGNPVVKAMFEIVANNLTEIGLAPQANNVDQPTFQAQQIAADLGTAWLQNNGQGGLSPATLLNSLPVLRKTNPSKFVSPEYDKRRQSMFTATSESDKKAALQKMTDYVLDQVWAAPIIQAPSPVVASSALHGLQLSPRGPVVLTEAYLSK
ncbi:ABC transporter substrate-binding protein [Arthrobacter sp. NtRootA1]|uniref:ABC transporter substrate-binding protein n=1 Tax=Arthrobacter sp. NtRootA1 TaxID=2830983 RepID=UPI001CC65A45|nr:ABC transporter substrate-binding protein [Arthrobacter sp. NtRootA1]BCW05925.1 ABC transporter substrate-binding protein [Arthrobacter sp. NtRootA1]